MEDVRRAEILAEYRSAQKAMLKANLKLQRLVDGLLAPSDENALLDWAPIFDGVVADDFDIFNSATIIEESIYSLKLGLHEAFKGFLKNGL